MECKFTTFFYKVRHIFRIFAPNYIFSIFIIPFSFEKMSRYNHPHILRKRTLATHILGGLLCVILLTLMCPHEASTKIDYELNQPWEREALIAKDSFKVFKSEEELIKERDSLKTQYQPYYNVDHEVAKETVSRFSRLPAD